MAVYTYYCSVCGSPASKPPVADKSSKSVGLGHWRCPKCGRGVSVKRVKN